MTSTPIDTSAPSNPGGEVWWRDAVIYQVYPRSFSDSDGDGIGDLPGVLTRLDHLEVLGVDAVWMSPFYPSPQVDMGYDVSDHEDVAPEYGTLADFDALLEGLHARGIRLLVDLVPNHTSDQHPWFLAAMAGDEQARSRYLIRRGRRIGDEGAAGGWLPPNNWRSLFGGSAWEPIWPHTGRSEDEGLFHLHLFDPAQPDLDWESPLTRESMEEVLRFWLDRGVDGFRVDVAHGMVKAPGLPDDPGQPLLTGGVARVPWPDAEPGPGVESDESQSASAPSSPPFFDQDGVHDIHRAWRRLLDSYPGQRVLLGEVPVGDQLRRTAYTRPDEMHLAFNFDVLSTSWDALDLRERIDRSHGADAKVGAPTSWVLGSHDELRIASRLGYPAGARTQDGIGIGQPQPDQQIGVRRAMALHCFLAGLPGVLHVYNGEELGLPEVTTLPDECRVDPLWERSGHRVRGRDGCRVPLPWGVPVCGGLPGDEEGSGAREVAAPSWLPTPPGWQTWSAQVQLRDENSPLRFFQRMLHLRRRLRLGRGGIEWIDSEADLAVLRNGDTVVALNTGVVPRELPVRGQVLLTSVGVQWPPVSAAGGVPLACAATPLGGVGTAPGQAGEAEENRRSGERPPIILPPNAAAWIRES
ncbi:alpha-amylase [Schaalia sp. 19OD2882]|uniref:alpha-amylase family glycosyl hydrolase n=1 Tax=Schaalia sp. 19OD2882 TaxID=2794089 RepID=UPI001C1EAEF3|nr:alpha-amylase family glycosyl hydrolase [Schaalia sp. 19OD2882]QWW19493.1 alpha-amylase [Schaalia sp. 19OD2882]